MSKLIRGDGCQMPLRKATELGHTGIRAVRSSWFSREAHHGRGAVAVDGGPLDRRIAQPPTGQPNPSMTSRKRMGLAVINAQRSALLDARDDGIFSSETLTSALDVLDADQISLELRGGVPETE